MIFDPQDIQEFWGKHICMHDHFNYVELEDVKIIPDFCKLTDYEEETI